jgi:hypothetical protein
MVKKVKAIPVTDGGGPLDCETSRLPHFLDNRLTHGVRLSALNAGSPLPPGIFLVPVSVKGGVDRRVIVRLQGLGQMKNPITSRIETATFQLVA